MSQSTQLADAHYQRGLVYLDKGSKDRQQAIPMYNNAIKVSRDAGDDVSRELFSLLLKDEEEHVDWLEMQLHQIKEIGYERYLSNQAEGEEEE